MLETPRPLLGALLASAPTGGTWHLPAQLKPSISSRWEPSGRPWPGVHRQWGALRRLTQGGGVGAEAPTLGRGGCERGLGVSCDSVCQLLPSLEEQRTLPGPGVGWGKPARGEGAGVPGRWLGPFQPGSAYSCKARACSGRAWRQQRRGGQLRDAAAGGAGGALGPGRSGVLRRAAPPGHGRRPRPPARPGSMDRSSLLQLIQEQVRGEGGAGTAPPRPSIVGLSSQRPSPHSPKPLPARPWPPA